jgi:hypothetical protein
LRDAPFTVIIRHASDDHAHPIPWGHVKKRTRKRRSTRHGISRIDQPSTRTHGWFVRVGYRKRRDGSYGAKHTKFFGDVSHGGKNRALKAAEKFVAGVMPKQRKAGGKSKRR